MTSPALNMLNATLAATPSASSSVAGPRLASGYIATPVTPTSNPSGTTGGGTSSTTSAAGSVGLLPILDGGYGADGRFAVLSVPMRPGDKPYPQGTIGIMIPGTKENSQESLFFPSMAATGADLIAVNAAGDPAMGSLVADLDKDNHIDLTRRAPLQSAWWVIKGDAENGESNELAWNLGKSGQGDVYGGMVIDSPAGNGSVVQGTKVIGCVSAHLGGFMDVGGPADKHQIHVDADGRAINACHITTGALFRADDKLDGPLMFENTFAPPVKCMPIQTPVHLGFDLARGAWRWWGESVVYTVTTPPPTKEPPRKPPWITTGGPLEIPIVRPPPWDPHVIDNPSPGDPPHIRGGDAGDYLDDVNNDIDPGFTDSGTGGSTPHDGSRIIEDILDQFSTGSPSLGSTSAPDPSDLPQSYAGTALQFAAPSIVAHPVATGTDSPDISSNPNPTSGELATYNDTAPVTGDMVAFGAGSDQGKWAYTTRPGNSRWKGGTADGGFVFLAPEASLLLQDPSVRNRPTSNSLVAAGPNVSWGSGTVDLATGGLATGQKWAHDGTGLAFSTPAAAKLFRVNDAGALDFAGTTGLAKAGRFTHSNAALRTYTFPDKDGTVAMLSDIGAGAPHTILSATHTDTTAAALVAGDLLYAAVATALLTRLPIGVGNAGKFLRSTTIVPEWSAWTLPASIATGDILYGSATNTVGGLATQNSSVLVTGVTGIPAFSTDLPTATTKGGTAIAGTGANTYTGAQTLAGAPTLDLHASTKLFSETLGGSVALTDAAPTVLDPTLGTRFTHTATANRTVNFTVGTPDGKRVTYEVKSDSVTPRVITFGTNVKSTGVLTTPASSTLVVSVTFESDGTNYKELTRQSAGI